MHIRVVGILRADGHDGCRAGRDCQKLQTDVLDFRTALNSSRVPVGQYQSSLYAQVKASPTLKNYPVFAVTEVCKHPLPIVVKCIIVRFIGSFHRQ